MGAFGKSGFFPGSRISWRSLVVLVAIFTISAGVVTRTFHGVSYMSPADREGANRQQLDDDAIEVKDPVLQIAAVLLPVGAPHPPPVVPQIRTVDFVESLYRRPPPSIPLL